jgi:hypothetical protein
MTVWRIYQLAPVTWPGGDRQGNPAGRGTPQREASEEGDRNRTETRNACWIGASVHRVHPLMEGADLVQVVGRAANSLAC